MYMLYIFRTVPLCPPDVLRVASEEHHLPGVLQPAVPCCHRVQRQPCAYLHAAQHVRGLPGPRQFRAAGQTGPRFGRRQ